MQIGISEGTNTSIGYFERLAELISLTKFYDMIVISMLVK
jgi:hypothetical protein